jgi:hypothetical protein
MGEGLLYHLLPGGLVFSFTPSPHPHPHPLLPPPPKMKTINVSKIAFLGPIRPILFPQLKM